MKRGRDEVEEAAAPEEIKHLPHPSAATPEGASAPLANVLACSLGVLDAEVLCAGVVLEFMARQGLLAANGITSITHVAAGKL